MDFLNITKLAQTTPLLDKVAQVNGTFHVFVCEIQNQDKDYRHVAWLNSEGAICEGEGLGMQHYQDAYALPAELKTIIEQCLRLTFSHKAHWCESLYFVKFSFVANEN